MDKEQNLNMRSALIIGGTGLVGRHCLNYLLAEPIYKSIILLTRRPLEINHPKLQVIIIDFDNINDYTNLLTGQDVYCAIGTTFLKTPNKTDYFKIDYIYPKKIAEIALQNGAKRFALVSAMSANPHGLFFYSRVKGQLEEALSNMSYKGIYIFRPSYLIGKRKEFRFIEKMGYMVLTISKPFLIGNLKKYRAIKASIVAKAMVLKTLEAKEGIFIYPSDQIQDIAGKLSN